MAGYKPFCHFVKVGQDRKLNLQEGLLISGNLREHIILYLGITTEIVLFK